ncbi:Na+/H+ antiporter NhaA [Myxococcus llanfairpwllgwyngyllgogerychwyrndrobwllllantysiliogogogochensis]|uniref:Na(+)/H(+) antiporter NhaA n=1 Tax=Myxococcus llanfairpwllgwyngyllgogerychwyrndrobwllllantysiliogogogochensis TaxID=2590453 RepID=A0A540WQX2_9BACT|nr:Na+/H+ antiporter NhaA [Myxococcus llanfairpwllgwyngyllgogerychwyrndrobwllllantysiliogogogochensis]TQF11411.1 Na+/H+ antiporter NhaA [Myxococcus llanfairpwllgwyngyllgogerychwyrndrobwllllantysiliogogogochensis]
MSTTYPPKSSILPPSPPEAWEPLLRIARLAGRPLERFLRIEAASGILLLVSAAIALVWANSPWAESYVHLWHTPIGLRIGTFAFERPLEWFVNDGLMVIFFFVVGMEIRREVHHGELSEWRRAALPAAAALGGMLAPAALYLVIAGAPETRSGWGVPMATDIAFALGILTLLGKRIPAALRVLLLALAVIDDLGAIVVIAIFYSSGVALSGLLVAALGFGGVFAMQRLGVRTKLAYVAPALLAWAGIYAAGIHPTIAGVLIGLMTPVRAWLGSDGFLVGVRRELEHLTQVPPGTLTSHELAETLRHVDTARREAMAPSESLIETLHPWVAFGIMPVFALANAGVHVSGGSLDASSWSVAIAVAIGLVVGKPLGVLLAIWATLRLRIGTLPAGMTPRHLIVLGIVAGVGFTMALFIAQLAFKDASLLSAAKLGILAASACSAVLGLILGRVLLSPSTPAGAAQSADEAESSTAM